MGVHGLSSFLRENKRALSTTLLFSAQGQNAEKTPLVVDGWSFIYKLVQDSNLPWVYGGEYVELARLVVKVVAAWLAVGLRPIFVFDGSKPSEKFATVVSRLNTSRVQQALLFFRTSSSSRNTRRFLNEAHIIPPLVYSVCVHALLTFRYEASEDESGNDGKNSERQLEIHFADEEGDPYAVELAGRVEGYVCGRDSDFVVLNSDGYRGYLSLDDLLWLVPDSEDHEAENNVEDGFQTVKSKKKAIPENVAGLGIIPPDSGGQTLSAALYTPASLAHHLKIPVGLLPLLGALVGNDFTKQGMSSTSMSSLSSPPIDQYKIRLLHASTTLRTCLRPPAGKRKQRAPQSVMELIQMTVAALLADRHAPASLTGADSQEMIVETIVQGIMPYAISSRPTDDVLLSETVCALHSPLECQLVLLLDRSDPDLPIYAVQIAALYLREYRLGRFSPSLMDILSTRTFWPRLFLEKPDVESATRSVSRPVREFGYALLEDGIGIPRDGGNEEEEGKEEEEEEDLDEMIDVVEEDSEESEYEDDVVADVGKLRGALLHLRLEEEEENEDSVGDKEHSVTEVSSSFHSPSVQSSSLRSPVLLSRLSYPRKPNSNRRMVITEYIRRGTRIVTEEVAVPAVQQLLTDFHKDETTDNDKLDKIPLQLQSQAVRIDALFHFLRVDRQSINGISKDDVMPVLSLRLVVRRMEDRAAEAENSKERQLERWTRREARAFLASVANTKSAVPLDPPEEVSERTIQQTAQISTALECIEHLVQILLLSDAVPGCAHRFSGLRFHALSASNASANLSSGRDVDVDDDVWRAAESGLEGCFAEERLGKKAKRKARQDAAVSLATSSSVNGKGKMSGAGSLYSLLADMQM
ncbi:hypothetical protein EW145_g3891 [Phellinidium pouzarii]|uniref:XPG N-terminal domain-containing protein n=1 Tax=Phellinidium pouzarii TaxID=167371 RepID=A0A4S4L5Q0_9AGAM|nr:hypothetical protein EW145_g3891 [Phellinidium pouzarii]